VFSPEIGGINFGGGYASVARPDHDQGFQQTTNVQYQFPKRGSWFGLTWRYDSGLVVVSVPDYATALALSGDEQQQIGLYCGATFATVGAPLRSCNSSVFGATRIHIVPAGTYNADTKPSRICASESIRSCARVGRGLEERTLFPGCEAHGTHFVTPRSVQGEVTFHF
jgi:hypothetical protein